MATQRFIVKESYGYGHRGGIRIEETTAPRVLARSTVNGLIRDQRQYASGHADHISDVISAGWRMLTAHHWRNGFENIYVLHIREATAFALTENGLAQ